MWGLFFKSRDGAVVRVLSHHQRRSGSVLAQCITKMRVEFVAGSRIAFEVFLWVL